MLMQIFAMALATAAEVVVMTMAMVLRWRRNSWGGGSSSLLLPH